MTKVNVKLLLYLLGAAALAGVGLFLVHYFQSGRIAQAMLWQAGRAEEKGELGQAARYLKRYLEFEPNDLDERARLGRLLADPKLAKSSRARENALFVLEQVVARDPDRHDLRRPLVRVAIDLAQYDLARGHLDVLEKTFPQDGEVQFLFGRWHEAQARYAAAAPRYRKAVELSPKKIDYLVRLADLLDQKLDRPGEADRVVQRARRQAPDDARVLLLAARLAQARGRLDAAEKDLNRGRRLHPRDPEFYQALARLEVRKDRRSKAIACLRQGIDHLPADTHPGLRWTLANLLLDDDRQPEAEKEMARLRKSNVAPAVVDYLQARLAMCRQQWARAARGLERVRPRLDLSAEMTAQIDLYLGHCYEHLDEPVRRLGAFKSAAERDPQSATALLELGAAEAALGRPETARAFYEKATQVKDAPLEAWLEYTRFLVTRNREALDREQANWEEVDKALSRAEEAAARTGDKSVDILLLRADSLAAQKQFKKAKQVLGQARRRQPRDVKVRMALVALAENQGDADEADRLLKEAEEELGDQAELRLGRARHLVLCDGAAAARALPGLARNLNAFSPADQSLLLRGLAELYYRLGDVNQAARLEGRAAELPPNRNDLRIRLRLFDLCLRAEDSKGVEDVLTQMRRLEGEQGTWWRYGRAAYLIWQVRSQRTSRREQFLDEARKLLDAVAAERPAWSAVPLARAEVEDLRGNAKQARAYYDEALKLGEKDKRVIREMVQLGQALAARGQRQPEAEQKLRQAVEVAGNVPETWVSLVQYLAATGQRKAAEAAIRDARARLESSNPRGAETALALGLCYEAVGRIEQANKEFLSALAGNQNDAGVVRAVADFYLRVGSAEGAKPLLERITGRQLKVTDGDIAWARRGLAMVLATGVEYRDFLEALKLLGLRLDAGGRVIEERKPIPEERDEVQRTRAHVLATRKTHFTRARAIALLEDLNRRRTPPANDRFLLAQLYDADDNWVRAQKVLHSLIADQPNNPAYLTYLAQSLVLRRKPLEAEKYIDSLARLEKAQGVPPGAFGSSELRARALEAAGQGEKALALLKDYAAQTPVRGENLLIYAGCLARHKRLSEAIAACERAGKVGPPEAAGGAAVAVLRSASPTPGECARVERLLKAALAKDPTSVLLQVQLADLEDLRGHFREAEALYRKVLRQDENNVMALNNLAWLLSHQPNKGREAEPLIERAVRVLGPRAELLDTRAVVYLSLGRSEDAIADLERAIADSPNPSRYFHLARALQMSRKPAAARKAFQKARAAGLEVKRLHPVERKAYHKIAAELNKR
jgi:tetratricopeptide (TPR) repeat protein